MKRLATYIFISVLIFGQWSCATLHSGANSQPVKYVYSTDSMHIQLEMDDHKIFRLWIVDEGGQCYSEGIYRLSDSKLKLKTLTLKGAPDFEKSYLDNRCPIPANSLSVLQEDSLQFKGYVLSRVETSTAFQQARFQASR